jgi:hypothetical protein
MQFAVDAYVANMAHSGVGMSLREFMDRVCPRYYPHLSKLVDFYIKHLELCHSEDTAICMSDYWITKYDLSTWRIPYRTIARCSRTRGGDELPPYIAKRPHRQPNTRVTNWKGNSPEQVRSFDPKNQRFWVFNMTGFGRMLDSDHTASCKWDTLRSLHRAWCEYIDDLSLHSSHQVIACEAHSDDSNVLEDDAIDCRFHSLSTRGMESCFIVSRQQTHTYAVSELAAIHANTCESSEYANDAYSDISDHYYSDSSDSEYPEVSADSSLQLEVDSQIG